MMDAAFEAAVTNLLKFEGGYVNDPVDPGGETNFGITKRTYPNINIRALKVEDAKQIYYTDWWVKNGLEQLPPMTGSKVLDMGVNMGMFHAVKILQLALCNLGVSVAVDGHIGPGTRGACSKVDDTKLVSALRVGQANYYRTLAADNPAMRKYLKGWLRRAAS